jgi:hypothetical protein
MIHYTPLVYAIALFFISAAIYANVQSQEPLTGKISERYLGIAFTVPDGWQAYKTEIGYLMVSETRKGFILVLPHDYNTVDELRQGAREGLADESGTMLQPEKEPEIIGNNGVSVEFTGYVEWQPAKAYALGLVSPHGGGVTILSAVEPESYSRQYIELVRNIGSGVEFTKPEIPPVVEQWKNNLSGMRLTYMHTYTSGTSGGFSDKVVINLCPDGSFSYSDRSNLSIDVGGAYGYSHGQGSGAGSWDVVSVNGQPALQLMFHDGSVRRHMISYQNNSFYLDNNKYFRTNDAGCR